MSKIPNNKFRTTTGGWVPSEKRFILLTGPCPRKWGGACRAPLPGGAGKAKSCIEKFLTLKNKEMKLPYIKRCNIKQKIK